MELLTDSVLILSALCKGRKSYGMLASFPVPTDQEWENLETYIEELYKAAPYLTRDVLTSQDVLFTGQVYLFFSSEEEMLEYYDATVGDDGPTETNKYDGPVKVYAITCDPSGTLLNENT